MTIEYNWKVEPEDMPVRGNVSFSGSPERDRKFEDEILERLDRGDEVAWCISMVEALIRYKGYTFRGSDALGGCSYKSEKQLRRDTEVDLQKCAKLDLIRELRDAVKRGEAARELLASWGEKEESK